MKRHYDETTESVPDEKNNDAHDASSKMICSSDEPFDQCDEPGGSRRTALICRLAPTCSGPNRATRLRDAVEMERHYAICHTHICAADRCHTVFPDERFLELHQVECHDTLAAIRKERGEKIFECFVATCRRNFLTPKGRRLHLINSHNYPKEYFFAITNKGIGGLLKKWGPGASLIRKEWKPREKLEHSSDSEDNGDEDGEEVERSYDTAPRKPSQMPKTVRDPPPHLQSLPPASTQNQSSSRAFATPTPSSPKAPPSSTELSNDADNNGAAMDVLIQNVSALTLVPSSIRFGRGGKQRGSAPRPRRNNQLSAGLTSNMELDLKSG